MELGEQEESRKEHWKLLGNLKTTVEGLVSINNPNVWSKYGGLERLCRDMHSILHHGLIPDKVCCRQRDYWQFVKDIRCLNPHAALHVKEEAEAEGKRLARTASHTEAPSVLSEGDKWQAAGRGLSSGMLRDAAVGDLWLPDCLFLKVPSAFQFIDLHEDGQQSAESASGRALAERWLQHSLQFHCLSAQLKPLLGNKEYIRKFYADSAFLLSDTHVTVMLQCLEAVEQNNPRLLAQIDASMFARKIEAASVPVAKSQSLTALPGSVCTPPVECTTHRCFGSFSGLHSASAGIQDRRLSGTLVCSSASQPQENAPCASSPWQPEGRSLQRLSVPLPHLTVSSPKDSSPAGELSAGTSANQRDDPWASGQDDTDGPEYLAIGNLGRPSRGRSSSSESSMATAHSAGSSSSNLFSSSSSQKQESVSSLGERGASGGSGGSRGTSLLRRSSFSEGQTSSSQGLPRWSHLRSHSDTSVASGKAHESNGDLPRFKSSTSCSVRSGEVSATNSIYMEYDMGQYLHSGEGLFRRPSEGQSLISYLSEQDFGSCADLEKENAHFSICESLIAAIELMKCNMMNRQLEEDEEDSDKEIQELKQKIRIRRQQIRTRNLHPAYQMGSDSECSCRRCGVPGSWWLAVLGSRQGRLLWASQSSILGQSQRRASLTGGMQILGPVQPRKARFSKQKGRMRAREHWIRLCVLPLCSSARELAKQSLCIVFEAFILAEGGGMNGDKSKHFANSLKLYVVEP
ncbi:Run domain Beclin-1-interacting and cysteine-rich domain-containing protein [Varanus komodoensis]|nr:Run domain Beclin-1-interacting and cysteine-rich domain-containing protein [Varanus komodoensis]